MGAEISPVALARLVDTAERPRVEGWSLRAALTRYAQPQPQRASDVIEALRRVEAALRPHLKTLERHGDDVWAQFEAARREPRGEAGGDGGLVELLLVLAVLDGLGDRLASWAVDRIGERPDAEVDAALSDVDARLERLGVPREERVRPTGRRGV